ncbi:MAG: rod shape-determining protein MreD [Alphaproteobacteria bacterium]|jgi:rod shape-determining protein MreD
MAEGKDQSQQLPWLKIVTAIGVIWLSILISIAPWPFAISALAPTAVAHCMVFQLSLRHANSLPPIACFMVGLFLDLTTATIFGLGVLTCMLVHLIAATQRQFLKSRGLIHSWVGVVVTTLFIAPISWIIASLYNFSFQPWMPTLAEFTLTIAIYPLIAFAIEFVLAVFKFGVKSS